MSKIKQVSFTLLTLLVLLSITGCKHDTFTVCGTLENGAGKTLWLEELAPEGPLFIDSIAVDSKGNFSYKYKMPYRSLYNLHTTDNNFAVLLPDYGEKVKIGGDWNNLSLTYTVDGSPESQLLWQLQQLTNDGAAVITDLIDTARHYDMLLQQGAVNESTVAAKRHITDSIYRAERDLQHEYVCGFIVENSGSLATMIALYKSFNTLPIIHPNDTASLYYYDLVLEGLQQRYPDNPHTLRFQTTVDRMHSALLPL